MSIDEYKPLDIRQFVEIRGVADAFVMRRIRNHCRQFMTGSTAKISWWQQLIWYHEVYMPGRRAGTVYGFLVWVGSKPVGYGLITMRERVFWLSGGILESDRGQGHGEYLFTHLKETVYYGLNQDAVFLDVLHTNPARQLYEKIGFREIGRDERVAYMRFPAEQPQG